MTFATGPIGDSIVTVSMVMGYEADGCVVTMNDEVKHLIVGQYL